MGRIQSIKISFKWWSPIPIIWWWMCWRLLFINFMWSTASFVNLSMRPMFLYISHSNPSILLTDRSSNKSSHGFNEELLTKTSDTPPTAIGVGAGISPSNEIRSIDSLSTIDSLINVVQAHIRRRDRREFMTTCNGYPCCGIPRIVRGTITKYTFRRFKES